MFVKPEKKKLRRAGYNAAQWTWGLPQTLLGATVLLMHRNNDHYRYKGARVTEWDRPAGLSLGKFIFVPKGTVERAAAHDHGHGVSHSLLDHEYGHTIQSLILGPFYLLLVGAPSLAWMNLPHFRNRRKKTGKSYYSPVFEKTANKLGKTDIR